MFLTYLQMDTQASNLQKLWIKSLIYGQEDLSLKVQRDWNLYDDILLYSDVSKL